MRSIKRTYDVVTPESAREGDFAECGELETTPIEPDADDIEEYGSESAAAVALAVKHIGRGVEASTSSWHPGAWYTDSDGSIDYATGAETRYSFHLDGFSHAEELELFEEITGRAARRRDTEDFAKFIERIL